MTQTPPPRQPAIKSLAELGAAQAQASQINTLPKTELQPGPEADDRDIVAGTTAIDHGRAGIPLSGLIDEVDRDLVMDPSKLEFERFMNQIITIHCHDAGAPEDPLVAEVTVNGVYRLVVRGQTADIPRCHAEVMARAKYMRVVQAKTVQPDGSIGFVEKAVLKHMYPFSVLHDPAGRRGADWVRQLFQSPA